MIIIVAGVNAYIALWFMVKSSLVKGTVVLSVVSF